MHATDGQKSLVPPAGLVDQSKLPPSPAEVVQNQGATG